MSTISNPSRKAGGASPQVQFNDAGTLAGAPPLTFDKATGTLLAGGPVILQYPYAGLGLTHAPGAAGQRRWIVVTDGASLQLVTLDDLGATIAAPFVVGRGGNTQVLGALTVAGGAVLFPATQVPNASAVALDDYHEIPFLPIFTGTSGQSGQIYNNGNGIAIKVGRVVSFTAMLDLNTVGTIAGNLQIEGLPFTCGAVPGAVAMSHWYVPGSTFSTVGGYVSAYTKVIALNNVGGAGAPGTFGMAAASLTAGTVMYLGGVYMTTD